MKKYKFVSKLLSPLIHTEETSGNVANIYRDKVQIDDKIHYIPAVHGNAIRGILRRVAMGRLCELVGIDKNSISERVYHLLFNGGALDKSTGYLELSKKREIRDLLPILSVFGSAMGNDMLPGKLVSLFAYPQCKELGTGEVSYNDLTSQIRYTRLEDREEESKDSSQMFYDIEVMVKGTILEWGFILDTENELEVRAFEDTLIEFSEFPYIGGAKGKGHGELDFSFKGENGKYLSFVEGKKEQIKNWIMEKEDGKLL